MLILEGMGLSHAIHEEHHDHHAGHGHGHIHLPKSGLVMAVGLSMHAIGDGLAIGAATASGQTSISVLVAFGVLVHPNHHFDGDVEGNCDFQSRVHRNILTHFNPIPSHLDGGPKCWVLIRLRA